MIQTLRKTAVTLLILLFTGSCFANDALQAGHMAVTAVSITAPSDITVNTDPWTNVATNVSLGTPAIVSDNSYSVSNDAPSSFPLGTTSVTWTVTDQSGNTAAATQSVTVKDAEKPQIFRMGEISVPNDLGKCGAVVQLFTPFAYDNSGSPVTITNDAPAFFTVGSVLITWTATDVYGNSDTSTQLITVIDNEAPTIQTTNITVSAAAGKNTASVALGTPVTADNCGIITSLVNDAPSVFPVGTTAVHWTVTDKTGYTTSSTQLVIVTDNEKPVLKTPAPVTVNNAPGKCGAAVALTPPAATDNASPVTVTSNAPSFFPTGTTIVTWTATDNSGNTSQATQSVTVKDAEAPVFVSLPATATVSCDNASPVFPVVTDNCTATPSLSLNETSTRGTSTAKSTYYNYTITRIWTAKDGSGNVSTAKQVITVTDKTAPAIRVPASISINNDANTCGAVVKYTVTATDNCGSPVTLTYSKASGTLFSIGITTVTVTAKDVTGNTSTQTFTVTVNDTQKPAISAPSSITQKSGSGGSIAVNIGTPATSDNCGIKKVSNNAPAVYPVGTTVVTWTVEDIHGNTATATQFVTITADATKKKTGAAVNEMNANVETAAGEIFNVTVAPNPSTSVFTLKLSSRIDVPVNLRVFDATGRAVDQQAKLGANITIQIGGHYLPGTYYAELMQGSQRKVVQLLKLR